jgi:hypothetical protein
MRNTCPDEAVFASRTTAVVADGVRYVVLPVSVVSAAIFGLAIIYS